MIYRASPSQQSGKGLSSSFGKLLNKSIASGVWRDGGVRNRSCYRTFLGDLARTELFEKAAGTRAGLECHEEAVIARVIQQSVQPGTLPRVPGFKLCGWSFPAHEAGGDYFDVLQVGEHSFLLLIADVMGSGIPAALFAATLRERIRSEALWTARPAELLKNVNTLMFDQLSRVDAFITAQAVLIDCAADEVLVGNAGHCPLLVREMTGEVRTAAPDGLPLGILWDSTYQEASIPLSKVDATLLYTDGITETNNLEGECFGQDRMADWLRLVDIARSTSDAALKETLLARLSEFSPSEVARDDQTFLLFARDGR